MKHRVIKSIRKNTFFFSAFIFSYLIIGCSKERILYPDPVAQNYFQKNIHFVVTRDTDASRPYDTIFFDKSGYVTHETGLMKDIYLQFDSCFFLTHSLSITDGLYNYYFTYHNDNAGNIVQVQHEIRHLNWDINYMDVDSAKTTTSAIFIVNDGKIVEERRPKENSITKFLYDDFNRLFKSEKTDVGGVTKWEYTYFNNKKLLKESKHFLDGHLRKTEYFSLTGLKDSTISNMSTLKYDYYFY
jgi:hypothetical protein